jgi:SAM-dependent methyltransferase
VRVCRAARSVLELGCGYGRMLSALAEPRRSLYGLELDASLLGLCRGAVAALPERRRRGVTLVRGDMRAFDLGRRFEAVILPYNALFCLLSAADVSRCLRAVRRALEPGGAFAFDVWNADGLDVQGLREARADEPLARVEQAGRTWSVFERCQAARARDRLDVTYTYVPSGSGKARQQTLQQRYYGSEQLLTLLERAGFEIVEKHGSFAGTRFGSRSARLVVSATPRA